MRKIFLILISISLLFPLISNSQSSTSSDSIDCFVYLINGEKRSCSSTPLLDVPLSSVSIYFKCKDTSSQENFSPSFPPLYSYRLSLKDVGKEKEVFEESLDGFQMFQVSEDKTKFFGPKVFLENLEGSTTYEATVEITLIIPGEEWKEPTADTKTKKCSFITVSSEDEDEEEEEEKKEGHIIIMNPLKTESFEGLIENFINYAFYIGVVLAPLFIIIGGVYFIFSGGDPSKIERGKKIIVWTIIGFLIIIFAKAIISIIKSLLGG